MEASFTSKLKKQVLVTFDFDAEGPGELTSNFLKSISFSVRKGEIIEVTTEIDEGWWEGFIIDDPKRQGMFPSNYTQLYREENSAPPSKAHSRQSSVLDSNRSRHPSIPTPQMVSPGFAKMNVNDRVKTCSLCGCDDFKTNAFKPDQCGNCFHKH
jgi:hypothetical protein